MKGSGLPKVALHPAPHPTCPANQSNPPTQLPRSKLYALGAAVGHVPRMSMGRNRWGAMPAAGGGDGMDLATLSGVRQMTPEAREVASRTYVAGGC